MRGDSWRPPRGRRDLRASQCSLDLAAVPHEKAATQFLGLQESLVPSRPALLGECGERGVRSLSGPRMDDRAWDWGGGRGRSLLPRSPRGHPMSVS